MKKKKYESPFIIGKFTQKEGGAVVRKKDSIKGFFHHVYFSSSEIKKMKRRKK